MKRDNLAMAGSFAQCADAFVEAVADLRAHGGNDPVIALVGSHLARADLQQRLHQRLGGALGVWLFTFRDLAERLGRDAPALVHRREADPLYQRALIARLLGERPASPLADLARYDGLAAALLRTFDDLEEAGCSRWPNVAPRAGRFSEIAALFDTYRDELTRAHFTAQDLLAASIERAADFPRCFLSRTLHVVGIYDVNPLQHRLLDALAGVVDVRFYAPRVLDPPPLLAEMNAPPPDPFAPAAVEARIWSCPTEAAEARAVAREARRLQRAGTPYHRMAVLTRTTDNYAELLDDVCRRAGVPCRLVGGIAPRECASLRWLGRLLGLLNSRFRRGEVMVLLRSVHLPDDFDPPAAARSQPLWDRVSRMARVRGRDDWDRRLSALAESADKSVTLEEKTAAGALRRVAKELLAGLRAVTLARRYGTAANQFERLARWLIARDDWLDRALEPLARLRLLDEAGLSFSPATFQARAAELMRQTRAEADDPRGLAVLDFVAARGLRFDVVFIPGCVESLIPLPARQDPFMLDDERVAFGAAVGDPYALPTRLDKTREELRLFDLACRAATKQLFLGYPRLDTAKDGRARLPSHLLLALAERAVGRPLTFDELPRQTPLVRVFPAARFAPDEPESALDEDELDLALMDQLAPRDETLPVRYLRRARPRTFARVWTKWVHRWARDELGEHDGLCASDPARDALRDYLADREAWRVSDLEKYACCPRRYLLDRILCFASPDDPEQVIALPANERGSLLHLALSERFNPRKRIDLEKTLRDFYAGLARENLTGGGVLDEVEIERLIESAQALVDFSALEEAEQTVEATEVETNATVDAAGRQVRLRARLDRVDRHASGGRRVIDYKTGKAKNELTGGKLEDDAWNAGATLQLPLYLLAYSAAHAGVSVESLSAAYWYLNRHENKPDPRAVKIGGTFMAAKTAVLRRVLREVVEGVEGGRFVPRPDVATKEGNDYCSHCDFKVICDPRSRVLLGSRARRANCCPWVDELADKDE